MDNKYMDNNDFEDIIFIAKKLMGSILFNILTDRVKIIFPEGNYIKNLGGLYYKNIKTIILYKTIKEKALWNFFHELGHHVFDHPMYGRFFKFNYLWQAFRNYQNGSYSFELTTNQAKVSLSEFFSELFALYFICPSELINNDKRLFLEFKNAFNNVINFYIDYNKKLKNTNRELNND